MRCPSTAEQLGTKLIRTQKNTYTKLSLNVKMQKKSMLNLKFPKLLPNPSIRLLKLFETTSKKNEKSVSFLKFFTAF